MKTLSDNLAFPSSRPLMRENLYRRRTNPVVEFLYANAMEDTEVASGFQALANTTSPSTLNAPQMRADFLSDNGLEILVMKFKELNPVAAVAEAALRAIANVACNQACARRMA
jgi:hypothetical protein